MPHIIIEYSENIISYIDLSALNSELHQALAEEGVDLSRIKTRAIPLSFYAVGNDKKENGHMIHITLLLLEGRDDKTKKKYAKPLHALAKQAVRKTLPNCSVTLEVRDMDKETYIL